MAAVVSSAAVEGAELPAWRLNALRCAYLLLVVGLGLTVWPGILGDHGRWSLMGGVVQCMLGALSLLAILGLRHPLRMLPLLLFEIAWKVIWLAVVAYPKWTGGQMTGDVLEITYECLLVVVLPLVVPWDVVARSLILTPGARWR